MSEGLFIVLEGIDGAGTTTQASKLAQVLVSRGLRVHVTREPSDGPIGVLIRQALTGRLVVPSEGASRPLDWATMALLFAADRVDHVDAEVVPNLANGGVVISDRYDYSSVAYQSISSGGGEGATKWVREINRNARRPDLTIVVDVTADVARERRASRGKAKELYEVDELQARLATFYTTIERYFPGDNVVHVDGSMPLEAVTAAIVRAVDDVRSKR